MSEPSGSRVTAPPPEAESAFYEAYFDAAPTGTPSRDGVRAGLRAVLAVSPGCRDAELALPRASVDDPESLRRVATVIEAMAEAMFKAAHPDGSWEDERQMLSGAPGPWDAPPPTAAYSQVPHYRRLAEAALAASRASGEAGP